MLLSGIKKDQQSITKDWEPLQPLIADVQVRQVRNVIRDGGYLTEIFRSDWDEMAEVSHIFQKIMNPGEISAWHVHEETTDRLFVSTGVMKIVLYDAREDSPTRGLLNVFRFGSLRPGLVLVPPEVWHGVMNIGAEPSLLLNLTDRLYEYENPDHWRLPWDTEEIPYRFK